MTWWLPPRAAWRTLRATAGLLRDSRAITRVRFLRAAEAAGVIEHLQVPGTAEELADVLGGADTGLLESLLEVGVAVGELRRRRGRYTIRGSRLRALAAGDGDPLRAITGELADYHGDVYRDVPMLLAGAQPVRYLDRYDELIARSSRVLEPYIVRFIHRVVADRTIGTMLEIGCGTGIYLRHTAQVCPQLRAVAVDMSERVSALAAANFADWGLSDRCTALHADIRRPDNPDLAGPFDLITLHNNVYYFAPAERDRLFADLRRRLAPGGRLVLTSYFAGGTLAAAEFGLVLRATAGCWPLPERAGLHDALRGAGYRAVAFHRLMAVEPLFGVVAEAD